MMLRPATPDDLPEINAIYNHYVLTSTATFQITPETEEARRQWFLQRDTALHPVMAAQTGDGRIAAWSSLSPFGKREAFAHSVENSLYVHPDFQRRGLGRLLLQDQLHQARAAGHRTIIAAICAEQEPSIALHLSHGFTRTGHLCEAGCKFGRWLDLLYLQRMV